MRQLDELYLAFGCALMALLCGCTSTPTTQPAGELAVQPSSEITGSITRTPEAPSPANEAPSVQDEQSTERQEKTGAPCSARPEQTVLHSPGSAPRASL